MYVLKNRLVETINFPGIKKNNNFCCDSESFILNFIDIKIKVIWEN